MLANVLAYLRCPVCSGELVAVDASLRCPVGHSFDPHRHGYVQLTAGPLKHTGDTLEMVAARASFLGAGHYGPITSAIGAALGDLSTPLVVDVGAGTGHHLAGVLGADRVGLALDVSKPALRLAARAHPRVGAVIADGWGRLPVADGVAGAVLDVFAPRNGAEFHRILHPGGRLIVVTPTPAHLSELARPLGLLAVDPAKEQRLAGALGRHFTLLVENRHDVTLSLRPGDVTNLVAMGPNAWHRSGPALVAGIAGLPDPVAVTASVNLAVYGPRSGG